MVTLTPKVSQSGCESDSLHVNHSATVNGTREINPPASPTNAARRVATAR
jgi:hypothetical protein